MHCSLEQQQQKNEHKIILIVRASLWSGGAQNNIINGWNKLNDQNRNGI